MRENGQRMNDMVMELCIGTRAMKSTLVSGIQVINMGMGSTFGCKAPVIIPRYYNIIIGRV